MKWSKLGIIFRPTGDFWWARSHAALPTPFLRPNGMLRVYFSSRDSNNVGRVGYIDLDSDDPTKVISVSAEPALDVGEAGAFDDNGVLATSVVLSPSGRVYLYYVGFELSLHVRYRLLTGLAVSDDGGERFTRVTRTPVLERSEDELYFRCGPFVLHEEERFRLWYVAGSKWTNVNKKAVPVYDLRYAESLDGIVWPEQGRAVLSMSDDDEHGFGRPYVVHGQNGYEMFYSIRRRSLSAYRLGYAVSEDGISWERRDSEMGLDVSKDKDDFDSEAICYVAPFEFRGRRYVLYNGNGFGETGIALAVQEG